MTVSTDFDPAIGPEVWAGADLGGPASWLLSLDDGCRRELTAAARSAAADLADPELVARDRFCIPRSGKILDPAYSQVESGRGFAVIRGVPVEVLTEAENVALACGVAAHVGEVVVQNYEGQRCAHVRDEKVPYSHRSRGYRSSAALPFHTDGASLFSLTCLGVAAEGGATLLASAGWLWNTLLRERPEVLPVLMGGFHHHRRGQHPPGEPPISENRVPVFAFRDGLLHCCYNRNPIEWVEKEGMRLTDAERDALDAVDEVLARPETSLEVMLRVGDMLLVNNFAVLHSRTSYGDDRARRRHLLRVWMDDPASRRVGETLLDLYVPRSSRFWRERGGDPGAAKGLARER